MPSESLELAFLILVVRTVSSRVFIDTPRMSQYRPGSLGPDRLHIARLDICAYGIPATIGNSTDFTHELAWLGARTVLCAV